MISLSPADQLPNRLKLITQHQELIGQRQERIVQLQEREVQLLARIEVLESEIIRLKKLNQKSSTKPPIANLR